MKKILLTIAAVIMLAAFFAGCKGPNTPSKGGGRLPSSRAAAQHLRK